MNVSPLNLLFGASLLAMCLVFTGCQTSVNTVSREPPAQRQMVTDKRVARERLVHRLALVAEEIGRAHV